MKIRISTIMTLTFAAGAALVLFQTSQNVQRAEDHLRSVHESLVKEQETVRVLEAEWDYLNRPDRLEDLARQYLKIQGPDLTALVKDGSQIPQPGQMIIPPRKPVMNITPAVLTTTPQPESAILGEDPVQEKTPPMPAPVTNDTRQQFNDLLGSLTDQEPVAGGIE